MLSLFLMNVKNGLLSEDLSILKKKVRLKYLVPLESVRANKLRGSWNTEVEIILEDLNKKYRSVHAQRRSVEVFDEKASQMLKGAKISVDTEVTNLQEKLEVEIGGSDRIQPSELSRMYGVDESVLIDLQVIDPLQNLKILCNKLQASGCDEEALTPVDEIIKMYVTEIKSVESTVWSGRSADQRKAIKMHAAKLNLNLKEIVHSLLDLTSQAMLEKEKRNEEVIQKIRNNLDKVFKSITDSELFQKKLEPFLGILA